MPAWQWNTALCQHFGRHGVLGSCLQELQAHTLAGTIDRGASWCWPHSDNEHPFVSRFHIVAALSTSWHAPAVDQGHS